MSALREAFLDELKDLLDAELQLLKALPKMAEAAQNAEHYEIAAYGTLTSWAVALGHDKVIQILKETLDEEKATDKKLTVIAQTVVNSQDSLRDVEQKKEPKPRRGPKPSKSKSQSRTRRTAPRTRTAARKGKSNPSKAPRSKRLRSSKRK